MKLLFYRYGSICEPDTIAGFQELGLEIVEMTEEMHKKNMLPSECIQRLSQHLLDHPVDFVFSINFFPAVAEVCHIFRLPYLSWSVDSPVMEYFTSSVTHDTNRIFLFDAKQFEDIAPLNPGHTFHLPLAANVSPKDELIAASTQADLDRFTSEVSFVGSLYTEKNPYQRFRHAPTYLTGYLDGLMQAQLRVYGYYFIDDLLSDQLTEEFKQHFEGFYQLPGDHFLTDQQTLSQLYIGTNITVMERDLVMQRLSQRFAVDIYTGSDTSRYPKLHNKGFAKTLTEMPIIFRQSKINLNLTAKSIRSGLPLRIWDILSSGGFCLTNYQPELPDSFTPGVHLDYYGSMDELEEKTAYYLSHEKERVALARNGYEEVKLHHTYPIRLAQMLQLAFTE